MSETTVTELIWQSWGKRLRKARKDARLSQEALATLIGMDQADISRYELGRKAVPDRVKVQFARFFDLGLDELFPWPTFLPPEREVAA